MNLPPNRLPAAPLRVAAVQMESQPGDKAANFAKIVLKPERLEADPIHL
jgi:hypothetical protein